MKFGEKVRDLRKKHSLTQDELAQCLGINKRTIIGWERDGRYPRSVEMLEKMADIFHVPLTYLQPDQSLFIERAAEAHGKKGKIEAQHLAFELTELFASGEVTAQPQPSSKNKAGAKHGSGKSQIFFLQTSGSLSDHGSRSFKNTRSFGSCSRS